MRVIAVRKRRGRRRHAITEGADSPRETLCSEPADGMVLDHRGINCPTCRADIARLGFVEVRS